MCDSDISDTHLYAVTRLNGSHKTPVVKSNWQILDCDLYDRIKYLSDQNTAKLCIPIFSDMYNKRNKIVI